MQSVIFNFIIKVSKKIYYFFSHSFLAKIFIAIYLFFISSINASAFVAFFKRDSALDKFVEESVISKMLLKIVGMFSEGGHKFRNIYEGYRSKSIILFFVDNWNLISIRIYGISMLSFGLMYGILRLFTNSLTIKTFGFCVSLMFAGVCFVLINKNLKSLFKGSAFLKSIGGISYNNASRADNYIFSENDRICIKGNIISGVAGAFLALLAVLLSSDVFFHLCSE